jgi:hypothetical protein
MKKRQNIYILGNSLILGVIGESLLHSDQFELTSLELPEDVKELEPKKPDAILFDLETPHMESVFSLSESCPELLLIGISPDTNIVRMWVGRQLRELSMKGLLDVIKDQLNVLHLKEA